jgi:hypothetical protein
MPSDTSYLADDRQDIRCVLVRASALMGSEDSKVVKSSS